jgi:hypothetical protein
MQGANLLRQVREGLQHAPVLLDAIDPCVSAAYRQVQACEDTVKG